MEQNIPNKIKAIFFDANGVIYYRARSHFHYNKFLDNQHISISPKDIIHQTVTHVFNDAMIGRVTKKELFSCILRAHGIKGQELIKMGYEALLQDECNIVLYDGVVETQLSLIPFPIDEIFLEELKNFDVLIFDNFSHRSYFNIVYLEKVRDFVREGGGLAMLGGTRSFESGGYAESPLTEVLPVEMEGKGGYETDTQLRAALTPAGKAHPITRLLSDPGANEEAWKKLPPLTTLNRVGRAKGETLVLARSEEHTSELQ